jgi:tetratricopeptide (TPR) repeat protein
MLSIYSREADAIIDVHLEKALELAPDLPEAHGVQGYFHLRRGRDAQARDALARAISLNPNYALAYNWRANIALVQGRFLDMLADKEKAYALDPMSLQISADLVREYRNFWRPKDAERVIDRMFDRHPDHPFAYRAAALNLGMLGRHGEAQLLQEKAVAANPDNEILKNSLPTGLYFMGLFEQVEELNNDGFNFMIHMIEGRFEKARALLDKHQEENPGSWLTFARMYYRVAGGDKRLKKLSEAVEQIIAFYERRDVPWRESCSSYLICDLRQTGLHEDAVGSMMAQCDTELGERLKANYFCPCNLMNLVYYAILDNRFDDAVERAGQSPDSGWSNIGLDVDPMFRLFSGRPEYKDLLDRNAEQLERQRQIYFAGKNADSMQSVGLVE